jgi:hypothetical protein
MNASSSKRRSAERPRRTVPWRVKPADTQCGYLIHGADTVRIPIYGAETVRIPISGANDRQRKSYLSMERFSEGTTMASCRCQFAPVWNRFDLPSCAAPYRLREQSKTIIIIIMAVVVEACNGPVVTRELLSSHPTADTREVCPRGDDPLSERTALVVQTASPGQRVLSHAPATYPRLLVIVRGARERGTDRDSTRSKKRRWCSPSNAVPMD